MLTVFGNLRINSLSRLQNLKDSFLSFNNVSDDWLINVRGTLRLEAISFIKDQLGNKVRIYNELDDSKGWINNALNIIKDAKHEYILVWNEDHLNIAPQSKINAVVKEMKDNNSDYLPYSWFLFGDIRKQYDLLKDNIDLKRKNNISCVDLTKDKWKMIRGSGYPHYLISMCGIFKKDFLLKMFNADKARLPISFKKFIFKIFGFLTKVKIISPYGHKEKFEKINRYLFLNKIRKYPIETPFEMEKGPERLDILPIKLALPNQELFACIDDDINVEDYSLISRGLHKDKTKNYSTKDNIENILIEIKTVLSKVDEAQVDKLIKMILSSKKIIAAGAGRVGMAARAFVMRLKHLGLDAYILGDANVPAINSEDLFLVCSGSGETQTIYELTLIAQKNLSKIALITGNPDSRIGKMSDHIVQIKAPSKVKKVDNFSSIQPMTTLNEQCLAIFFDAVVLGIMKELNETHDTMWARHSNLE